MSEKRICIVSHRSCSSKCAVLKLVDKRTKSVVDYTIEPAVLEQRDNVKELGISLCSNLPNNSHIEKS